MKRVFFLKYPKLKNKSYQISQGHLQEQPFKGMAGKDYYSKMGKTKVTLSFYTVV